MAANTLGCRRRWQEQSSRLRFDSKISCDQLRNDQEPSAAGFCVHEPIADSRKIRDQVSVPFKSLGCLGIFEQSGESIPWLIIIRTTYVDDDCREQDLLACLSGAQNLTVVSPDSPSYNTDRLTFNRRFAYRPAAIVYSTGVQDVQVAVQCGASSGTPVVARSGGHSYAAYGTGGQDASLVIDLSRMASLTLNNLTGEATAQTGIKLGPLAQGLWDQGRRALPHGICPYVGIGGHTAYGGAGLFSRQAGLLIDRAVRAEVVLANGTVATAALRGAGPSFGIVTAWTYATLPAPNSIGYILTLKPAAGDKTPIIDAFNHFQTFARNALPTWGIVLAVVPDGPNKLAFEISGNFYGSTADFNASFQPLLNSIPQAELTSQEFTWIEALANTAGSLSTVSPEPVSGYLLLRSLTELIGSCASLITFMPSHSSCLVYGGEIARASSNVTSFFNRDAFLTFQFYASAKNLTSPYPASGLTFVSGMHDTLQVSPEAACKKRAYTESLLPRLTLVPRS
ncbi:glucooligosaccharide oxidase [Rhizoctonia solani AG-1 IA]|uniref:Glucooligosaccharide oxidase n=1 Tax=Thanatephorus cucumeris (strain AG1-IA) TaxID=983506 RepID=L8WN99_THACA|nr:glucooligosaccharide oxidase [Rhizoctonia solani AG-1 IA]